jgi:pimeloyl-ACP methyl ester carboxylesterase
MFYTWGFLWRLAVLVGGAFGLFSIPLGWSAAIILCVFARNHMSASSRPNNTNFPSSKSAARLRKASQETSFQWGNEVQRFTFVTRDGVKLHYSRSGSGDKLILLGNGVGCVAAFWLPLLKFFNGDDGKLAKDYTVVSWDYRGLFRSAQPLNAARISIRDSAEDAHEILQQLGGKWKRFDCVFGWSTGVQVALELACLYPEEVGKLVLLNGAHGHTLQVVCSALLRPFSVARDYWLGFHPVTAIQLTDVYHPLRPPRRVWDSLSSACRG